MNGWGGFWIGLGLAFLGLCVDNGLANIANKLAVFGKRGAGGVP